MKVLEIPVLKLCNGRDGCRHEERPVWRRRKSDGFLAGGGRKIVFGESTGKAFI